MKSILSLFICILLYGCGSDKSQSVTYAEGRWALPVISTAHIRTEPRHSSEMSSQALMGTPLKLKGTTDNGWCLIETPEGYTGYINGNTLTVMDDSAFTEWRRAPRLIVTSPSEIKVFDETTLHKSILSESILSDLIPGCIIEGKVDSCSALTYIILPDGRRGYVESCHVADLEKWSDQKPSADCIVNMAKAQTGSPYLWGGLSSKGMDCSGLTKMAFYGCGLILPRDASQQALRGNPVETDSLKKGDLVFFGNISTGRVNHVGIYDSDGFYIEAAGKVQRSLLSENANFLFARRIIGSQDSIATVRSHPWYFITNNQQTDIK